VLVDVELEFVSVEVVPVAFFLVFFLWTFFVLDVVAVSLDVEVFCAFLAAVGAAIRKGTAATVRRVDVNSFFIGMFSLFVAGSVDSPLTFLLCPTARVCAITSNRRSRSRVLGIAAKQL
jgi:hypothetical protein